MIFFAILVFFETKKESPEGLPFPLLSNTIILVLNTIKDEVFYPFQ